MAPSLACSMALPSSISIAKFIETQPHLQILENQCRSMRDLRKLHSCLIKTGLVHDKIAASRILNFAASSAGDMDYAYLVFLQIHDKNLFAWNTIIRGLSRSSCCKQAISVFIDMLETSSFQPQRLTYPSVFRAYGDLGLACYGMQLHGRAVKEGHSSDPFVRNTILYMYANCGYRIEAQKILIKVEVFDIVAWNSIIIGLAKSGFIDESRKLFDEMPDRNTISWNSMISGYVRNGNYTEAFKLFREMQVNKVECSEFTMVALLNACASTGAIKQGKWIHAYIERQKFDFNGIVVTALVEMYCKCACVEEGFEVFNNSSKKHLSVWNSMMFGLANNGLEEEAMKLFSELESSNLEPDSVSFIAMLTACNHSGKIEEAKAFFSSMTQKYKVKPSIKHYTCMVDLLGRAGFLDEAELLINNMPVSPDATVLSSLLSSCRMHGNIEKAEAVAQQLLDLDSDNSGGHVLMANAYAALNRFEEAIEQRVLMKNKGIEKDRGSSSIEIDSEIHEFTCGGRFNQISSDIFRAMHLVNWNLTN